MSTTKVNKVSAEKAVANQNANKSIILQDIFAKVKKESNGLLKTSLGQKVEVYKRELFAGMEEKKIKATRKKLRNMSYSLLSAICEEKNKENQKKLVSTFTDFYKEVYRLNDFSFASIASDNTKDEKKEVLKKGLEIVKNFK